MWHFCLINSCKGDNTKARIRVAADNVNARKVVGISIFRYSASGLRERIREKVIGTDNGKNSY